MAAYSKRPLWQWILLYVVLGAVVYAVVYYFVFAKKGSGYNYNTYNQPVQSSFLKAPNGMTLYIFDKDKPEVSNCYNSCATLWPPFLKGTVAPSDMTNIITIKRTDGSMQYAFKGMPLYYYTPDKKPGDVLGDGVGGVWHLVKP